MTDVPAISLLMVGLIGLLAASTGSAKGNNDATAYTVPFPLSEDVSQLENEEKNSVSYSHKPVKVPIKSEPVPLDPVRHRKLLEAIYSEQNNSSYAAKEGYYLARFGAIEWHQDQKSHWRRNRAVNALSAPANELGWVVSVEAHFPGSSLLEFCTGSLISNQVVISAAHCVFRDGVFASWLQVTYGGNAQTAPSVITSMYVVDLRYLSNTEFACGDVALIFLPQPIALCGADGVRAIRMPWELGSAASVRRLIDGVTHSFSCYSLGFGITESRSSRPET
ncbi:hypothetical protein AAVH_22305 [Aphelenchoides avenae]|nr:hypothetical protein AAVH_22305 [Aphelenchus avenae]